MNDDLIFADEPESSRTEPDPWKILVVDDEPGIHEVTKLALSGMTFDGRGIALSSAYSGLEGQKKISAMPDTALILLDVIMEREDSGLQLVKYVRCHLNNQAVRIILRTGQPGDAPERKIIIEFDINDYKAKNELTSQKLFTTVVTALRSYRDIKTIESHVHGLEQIINASSPLFGLQAIEEFVSLTLKQLDPLLGLNESNLTGPISTAFLSNYQDRKELSVLAGTGEFLEFSGRLAKNCFNDSILCDIDNTIKTKAHLFNEKLSVLFIATQSGTNNIILFKGCIGENILIKKMLDILANNIAIAFDNILLFEQLNKAHKTAIQSLVILSEFNNPETGHHLRQTELLTTSIAEQLYRKGYFPQIINKQFIAQLGMAAILYDVGNAGIPKEILAKPDKLTEDDWKTIQEHVNIGSKVLKNVADHIKAPSYLSLAVEIAAFHHERYDSSGYHGLPGEKIPISARILSVVDTYLALISKRPHKEPLTHEQAMAIIQQESSRQFDPIVVTAFLDSMHEKKLPSSAPHTGTKNQNQNQNQNQNPGG